MRPEGLSLNKTTGLISGTPQVGSSGSYPFTVAVTDAAGAVVSQPYTVVISAVSLGTLSFNQWTMNKTGFIGTIAASTGTGSFTFSMTSGKLPTGPFDRRPDIRFDALIEVSVTPGQATTARIIDLANHTTTNLPPGSFSADGRVIAVHVPGSLLPSTGLPPSQFRFNYWPEDPDPTLNEPIASFVPEFNDAQIGVIA